MRHGGLYFQGIYGGCSTSDIRPSCVLLSLCHIYTYYTPFRFTEIKPSLHATLWDQPGRIVTAPNYSRFQCVVVANIIQWADNGGMKERLEGGHLEPVFIDFNPVFFVPCFLQVSVPLTSAWPTRAG
jgi:hypothetical protein